MKDKTKGLSAPLRVYWALSPADSGGLDSTLAANVAAELNALKVFFVTLRLYDGARPDLARIISSLKPAVRVIVSVADVSAFPDTDALSGAAGLDLMPSDAGALRALLGLAAGVRESGRIPVSISVVPARDNTAFLDEAIGIASEAGIRVFNIPNPDVTGPGAAPGRFALDAQSRAELKDVVERRLGPLGQDIRLNVHDLFLHTELKLPGLGGRIEYAGCQAADAIAYIDRTGVVYPCSSWPEPLGSLTGSSFAGIWSGDLRRSLRERAHTLPDECGPCPDSPDCKGGCIGLAEALGRKHGKDPGCPR